MNFSKIHEAVHNHILFGEVLTSVKRIWKAFQIWRIDRQYLKLNQHFSWYEGALKDAQTDVQRQRVAMMIRRQNLRREMRSMEEQR